MRACWLARRAGLRQRLAARPEWLAGASAVCLPPARSPPTPVPSPSVHPSAAGKDGGFDVNRLMEMADEAEEEEWEEGTGSQQDRERERKEAL